MNHSGKGSSLFATVVVGAIVLVGVVSLFPGAVLFLSSDTATVFLDPEAASPATMSLPPTEGAIEVTYSSGALQPTREFKSASRNDGTTVLVIEKCTYGCRIVFSLVDERADHDLGVQIRYLAADSEYVHHISVRYPDGTFTGG